MKKIFILGGLSLSLLTSYNADAQSFTCAHDTVWFSYTGTSDNIANHISVPSGGPNVTLNWKVVGTNFSTDWIGATGICDNNTCLPGTTVATGSFPTQTSSPYIAGATGDFHMQFNGAIITSSGTNKYMRVRLINPSTSDTAYQTYIVSAVASSVRTVSRSVDEISLYPNPANNEINVVFDAAADVKSISVHNLIGKVMGIYRVSGNSANLNIENLPSGIYFVRLTNAHGEAVITRKFTKQ